MMRYLVHFFDRHGVEHTESISNYSEAFDRGMSLCAGVFRSQRDPVIIYALDDLGGRLPELVGQVNFECGKTYIGHSIEGRVK